MSLHRFPRLAEGGQISAAEFNRLLSEVERSSRLAVYPPLQLRQEATGYHLLLDPSGLQVVISATTPAAITTNQNNYTIDDGALWLRANVTSAVNWTGFTGGDQGRVIYVTNVGTSDITFQNENASSTAINRILTPDGNNYLLSAGESVTLFYDGTSARWRIWDNLPAGMGTVTSVALSAPAELTVSGSPVTTSGTLTLTKATQAANTAWSGPVSGAAAAPTFRVWHVADLPATAGGSTFVPTAVPTWVKITKTHTQFQAAATTNDIELYSLPAGGVVHAVKVKHSVQFAGTGITSYFFDGIGISGSLTKYWIAAQNTQLHTAVSATNGVFNQNFGANLVVIESHTGATSIRGSVTSVGANLDQSTAGSVDVWLKVSKAT